MCGCSPACAGAHRTIHLLCAFKHTHTHTEFFSAGPDCAFLHTQRKLLRPSPRLSPVFIMTVLWYLSSIYNRDKKKGAGQWREFKENRISTAKLEGSLVLFSDLRVFGPKEAWVRTDVSKPAIARTSGHTTCASYTTVQRVGNLPIIPYH